MIYFDTSFLAPLILEEASSARVEAYVNGFPLPTLDEKLRPACNALKVLILP